MEQRVLGFGSRITARIEQATHTPPTITNVRAGTRIHTCARKSAARAGTHLRDRSHACARKNARTHAHTHTHTHAHTRARTHARTNRHTQEQQLLRVLLAIEATRETVHAEERAPRHLKRRDSSGNGRHIGTPCERDMWRELIKDVWAAELAANRQTSTPATNGFARIRRGTRMDAHCAAECRIYTKSTRRSLPSAGMVLSLFRWTADASHRLCSRRAMRDECSTAQRLAFKPNILLPLMLRDRHKRYTPNILQFLASLRLRQGFDPLGRRLVRLHHQRAERAL